MDVNLQTKKNHKKVTILSSQLPLSLFSLSHLNSLSLSSLSLLSQFPLSLSLSQHIHISPVSPTLWPSRWTISIVNPTSASLKEMVTLVKRLSPRRSKIGCLEWVGDAEERVRDSAGLCILNTYFSCLMTNIKSPGSPSMCGSPAREKEKAKQPDHSTMEQQPLTNKKSL